MRVSNVFISFVFSMLVFAGCKEDKKQVEAAVEPETEESQGDAEEHYEDGCEEEICWCERYRSENNDSKGERVDIVVKTANEFLAAIQGSNRNILIKEGVYKFKNGIRIEYAQNITIKGMGNKPVELIVDNSMDYVTSFFCVENITIENLKVGHSGNISSCDGGVFSFKIGSNIKVNNTHMYGSGTVGLELNKVSDMEVTNSSIYECSEKIMQLGGNEGLAENISFKNCLFQNNKGDVSLNSYSNVVFDGCEFRKNSDDDYSYLFEAAAVGKNIIIKETCTFDGKPFGSSSSSQGGPTFTDHRDKQIYRTVVIGDFMWMAQNINFKTANSWCYENDDDNCAKHGRLYNRDAAMMACPAGWHLPNREELEGLDSAFMELDGELWSSTEAVKAEESDSKQTGFFVRCIQAVR